MIEKISPPSKFTANIVSGNFSGVISFDYMAETEILFTKPASVKGLKLSIINGKCSMSYSDMVFEAGEGEYLQASLGNMLVNTISDIIVNNETVEATEENGLIKRITDDYTIYQNIDGTIKEISYQNCEVKFTQK